MLNEVKNSPKRTKNGRVNSNSSNLSPDHLRPITGQREYSRKSNK